MGAGVCLFWIEIWEKMLRDSINNPRMQVVWFQIFF